MHVLTHTHTRLYVTTFVCIHVHMCICIHVLKSICMYLHEYICMYMQTHMGLGVEELIAKHICMYVPHYTICIMNDIEVIDTMCIPSYFRGTLT